ncbi:MAG: hypothetical protein GY950_25855 [bacterium]|nr:hypothetical protein [bacterium]
MKKIIFIAVLGLVLYGLTACGGGKYAEPKDVLEKYVTAMEDVINAFDKAGDADAVAAALNKYSDYMKDLGPKLKEMSEKYPELSNKDNPPEELLPLVERLNAAMGKFEGAMAKVGQYATDPKVMEAQKKFMEAMSSMR